MTITRTSRALGLASREGTPDWRHAAACHDLDPELFFPVGVRGDALRQTRLAQAVCLGCSVRQQCLEWAMDSGQEYGVWGSLSENQRRALKRGRTLALTSTEAPVRS